jgi:hypothetical protein
VWADYVQAWGVYEDQQIDQHDFPNHAASTSISIQHSCHLVDQIHDV